MSNFNVGDVVVHKSMGSQPLVVTEVRYNPTTAAQSSVVVRYGTTGTEGLRFGEELFYIDEVETPIDSISREAEVFKALTAKRAEIDRELNGEEPKPGTLIPFNKLN